MGKVKPPADVKVTRVSVPQDRSEPFNRGAVSPWFPEHGHGNCSAKKAAIPNRETASAPKKRAAGVEAGYFKRGGK